MYMRILDEIDVAAVHQSPPTTKSVRARLRLEIESIFYGYRPISGWWRPFCPRFRINHGWITLVATDIFVSDERDKGVIVGRLEWYKYVVLYFTPRRQFLENQNSHTMRLEIKTNSSPRSPPDRVQVSNPYLDVRWRSKNSELPRHHTYDLIHEVHYNNVDAINQNPVPRSTAYNNIISYSNLVVYILYIYIYTGAVKRIYTQSSVRVRLYI